MGLEVDGWMEAKMEEFERKGAARGKGKRKKTGARRRLHRMSGRSSQRRQPGPRRKTKQSQLGKEAQFRGGRAVEGKERCVNLLGRDGGVWASRTG
jgi:hypothetical protein